MKLLSVISDGWSLFKMGKYILSVATAFIVVVYAVPQNIVAQEVSPNYEVVDITEKKSLYGTIIYSRGVYLLVPEKDFTHQNLVKIFSEFSAKKYILMLR